MSKIKATSLIICTSIMACTNQYQTTTVKPDVDNTIILERAPNALRGYDPPLADQWDRTYNHSAQIRKAMVAELNDRQSSVSTRKGILTTIGAAASLANAVYIGIRSENHTTELKVTLPLSLVSGGALLGLLPGDDRISLLQDKIAKMTESHIHAKNALDNVEKRLLDQGYASQKKDSTNAQINRETDNEIKKRLAQTAQDLSKEIEVLDKEIIELKIKLSDALDNWARAAE